jgi:mannose-6-phosphate isomerase-like protein (cupin superfamily)
MITKDDCDTACFTFLSVHEAGRHHHDKTTEFYYVLKGKGILELDEERVEVEPGTVVMIPPGIRHKAVGEIEALIVGMPSLDPADFFMD